MWGKMEIMGDPEPGKFIFLFPCPRLSEILAVSELVKLVYSFTRIVIAFPAVTEEPVRC